MKGGHSAPLYIIVHMVQVNNVDTSSTIYFATPANVDELFLTFQFRNLTTNVGVGYVAKAQAKGDWFKATIDRKLDLDSGMYMLEILTDQSVLVANRLAFVSDSKGEAIRTDYDIYTTTSTNKVYNG